MDDFLTFAGAHPFLVGFTVFMMFDFLSDLLPGFFGRRRKKIERRLKAVEERLGVEGGGEDLEKRVERLEAMSGGGPFRVRASKPIVIQSEVDDFERVPESVKRKGRRYPD